MFWDDGVVIQTNKPVAVTTETSQRKLFAQHFDAPKIYRSSARRLCVLKLKLICRFTLQQLR